MKRLLTCVTLAFVTACGVPVEAEPEEIVLDVEPPPQIEEPVREDLASVSIYLVRDDSLVHATRDLPAPARPDAILASLFEGVTDPERRADLRTSIPPGSEVLEVREDGPVLRLDLSRDFAAVGGEEEIHAVAQIVLTATSIEGVELVAFELEGVPTDVPVASGALSVEPVGPDDYLELLGP